MLSESVDKVENSDPERAKKKETNSKMQGNKDG
jgi:hypothetical protein